MNPELVLVVGDMFVPQRSPDICQQFKEILIPNKIQHVLSLGNIGSRESYDWLRSLSNDFHCVKGDYDEGDMPEKKVVQIGEFKIGMIHGHQVLPWGDIDALSNIQRELGCDIMVSGHTHKYDIKHKENKFYINPGSISGAFSHLFADPSPSFVLMVLQGEDAIVYFYVLNDKNEKFSVKKLEFSKGSSDFKEINEEENNEEEDEEEKKEEVKVEEEKQENPPVEEMKPLEEVPISSEPIAEQGMSVEAGEQ